MDDYAENLLNLLISTFGDYDTVNIYSNSTHSIQMLSFPNCIPEHLVVCSMGISKYQNNREVFIIVNRAFFKAEYIISSFILKCLSLDINIIRGVTLYGIEHVDSDFSKRFNKDAIYISYPELNLENLNNKMIDFRFLQALFINKEEYKYAKDYGWSDFETYLVKKEFDIFNLN